MEQKKYPWCRYEHHVESRTTTHISLMLEDVRKGRYPIRAIDMSTEGYQPIRAADIWGLDATVAITPADAINITIPPGTVIYEGDEYQEGFMEKAFCVTIPKGKTVRIRSMTNTDELLRAHLQPSEDDEDTIAALADHIDTACVTDHDRRRALETHFPNSIKTLSFQMALKSRAHARKKIGEQFTDLHPDRVGLCFNARSLVGKETSVEFVIQFVDPPPKEVDLDTSAEDEVEGDDDDDALPGDDIRVDTEDEVRTLVGGEGRTLKYVYLKKTATETKGEEETEEGDGLGGDDDIVRIEEEGAYDEAEDEGENN